MGRNYDELFAEMLMNIDRHTEELTKQSEESTRRWDEQHLINQSMLGDLKQISTHMKTMEETTHQHMDQKILTATILDRIIRKNQLKV